MRTALLWMLLSFLSRETTAQHLPITLYTSQDGAYVIGANSIFQDKESWIWFTDGFHVSRYDGHRFKNYFPTKKTRLEFAFDVFEVENEIWVLSYPYHLKIQGDSLVQLDSAGNFPSGIAQSLKVNGKWFILADAGLYEYNKGVTTELLTDSSFKFASVGPPLLAFNDSLLLAYNAKFQLVIFDIKNRKFEVLPIFAERIKQDQKGRVFFIGEGNTVFLLKGISKTSASTWNVERESYFVLPWKKGHPAGLVIDHSGNIWVCEQFRRLIRISPEKQMSIYTEEHGLPSLWFNDFLVDREGLLWIANNGGICKIRQSNWDRFTIREGLSSNHVIFISEGESDSTLYIVTQDGVNLYRNRRIAPLYLNNEILQVNSIQEVDGKIIYAKDARLYQASISKNDNVVLNEQMLQQLPGSPAELIKNKQGAVFMSVQYGLGVWYKNKLYTLNLEKRNFRRLMIDSRGDLWAASFGHGLFRFKVEYNGENISLRQLDYLETITGSSVPLRSVRSLAEDSKGNIIAGSRYNGLFYLFINGNKVDSILHYDIEDGLASNTIWGLGIDKNNEIWIGTALGLNSGKWKNGKFEIEDISKVSQAYSVADIFIDKQNSVWVANHPGLTRLRSSEIRKAPPFNVHITRILQNGRNSITRERNSFNYLQNNFIIEFSSNTFLDEKKVTYSYRLLSNEDEPWTEPQSVHSVNYSSLKPGQYRFQVRAINIDGTLSENIAEYPFEINPPFWQTPWFIVLLVVLVASGFYSLYRYRIAQLLRLQEMRNNISRNLHDDIGASLSNINILNELAKRNMQDEVKAGLYLSKAGDDIQRISESLSDIVWNISPRYDDLENLFIRMKRYAADMLEGKNITAELYFPVVTHHVNLPMDQRRDFYLIFKEAVNNLVKYSKATQALVEVKLNSHSINLLIRDNGKGFDSTKTHPEASGGNGLYNMKQRADKWKGDLSIESLSGQGTVVKVTMRI